ncbi:MAG TPA: diguanylate cyclase, partial [Gaiellaceae bacterium]|nr:diguanylate cyclase [Gaiellaceae bacterium]
SRAAAPPRRGNGGEETTASRGAVVARADALADTAPSGPASVAVVAVSGLDDVQARLGDAASEEVLAAVESALGRRPGASTRRLPAGELVLVLPGATVDEAEELLSRVQTDLRRTPPYPDARLSLCAGVSALPPGGSMRVALRHAELALWQARRTGDYAVVIATVDRDRPEA